MESSSINNLVKIYNKQIVVSTRQIAASFNKRHTHVLDSIKELLITEKRISTWFLKSEYKDNSGKTNYEYLMNYDGFMLLTMNFKGKKFLEVKNKIHKCFQYDEKIPYIFRK